MKLDASSARLDLGGEAVALREQLVRRGLHLVIWMVDMWWALMREGCHDSLPSHPLLLLVGYYEQLHPNQPSFRIQRHISEELDKHLASDLQTFSKSDPSLAARTLSNQNSGATAWLRTLPVKHTYRLAPAEFQQGVRIFAGLPPA